MSNPLDELRRMNVAGQRRKNQEANQESGQAPAETSEAPEVVEAPIAVAENSSKASILPSNRLTVLPSNRLDGKTSNQLTSYTPAKSVDLMTEEEMDECVLPSGSDEQAVLDFLSSAARYKRVPVAYKGSTALEWLMTRLLREAYKNKKYKQDLVTRGIMLVLYEHYTGKSLVQFPGDEADV